MKGKYLILILVLIFGFIIFLTNNRKEEYFENVKINKQENKILNRTKLIYLDTIIYTGLNILKIDKTNIILKSLDEFIIIDEDIDVQGYIQKVNEDFFIIYVKEGKTRTFYIDFIAHELIHLKQYVEKELIICDKYIVYKGVRYNKNNLPLYFERPWEVDVIRKSISLKKEMNNILF